MSDHQIADILADVRPIHIAGRYTLQSFSDGVIIRNIQENYMGKETQKAFVFPDSAEPEYHEVGVRYDKYKKATLLSPVARQILGAQDMANAHWVRSDLRNEIFPRIMSAHLMSWATELLPIVFEPIAATPNPLIPQQRPSVELYTPQY